MRRWSPYAYAFDNPIRYTDPEGMAPSPYQYNWENGKYYDKKGNEVKKSVVEEWLKNNSVSSNLTKFDADDVTRLVLDVYNKNEKGKYKVSKDGLKFIIGYGGFSASIYDKDGNGRNATIGFGTLLHQGAITGDENYKLCSDDVDFFSASALLAIDVATKGKTLNNMIENRVAILKKVGITVTELTQAQFDAVFSLYYNSGGSPAGSVITLLLQGKTTEAYKMIAEDEKGGNLNSRRKSEAEILNGTYNYKTDYFN